LGLPQPELKAKVLVELADFATGLQHPPVEVEVAVYLHLLQELHARCENSHSVHNRSWQSQSGDSPLQTSVASRYQLMLFLAGCVLYGSAGTGAGYPSGCFQTRGWPRAGP
jgi:hypothetical protein